MSVLSLGWGHTRCYRGSQKQFTLMGQEGSTEVVMLKSSRMSRFKATFNWGQHRIPELICKSHYFVCDRG